MNLYAILPSYAPRNEVELMLAESDKEVLDHAIFSAAHDLTKPGYGSPSADVYLIAKDVQRIGTSYASDAPRDWKWAHPAVEEALAEQALQDAANEVEYG